MSRVSWLNVIESTARAKSRLRPVLISRKEKKIESLKTCNFTIIDNGSLKRTASKAGELIGRRPCPKEKEARRTWSWNTTKRECRRSRWVPTHVLMFRVVACWTFLVFLKFSSKLNFKTIFTTAEASPLTFRCSKPSTDNSARSFVLESLRRNRRVFILCKSIYDGFRKQKKKKWFKRTPDVAPRTSPSCNTCTHWAHPAVSKHRKREAKRRTQQRPNCWFRRQRKIVESEAKKMKKLRILESSRIMV